MLGVFVLPEHREPPLHYVLPTSYLSDSTKLLSSVAVDLVGIALLMLRHYAGVELAIGIGLVLPQVAHIMVYLGVGLAVYGVFCFRDRYLCS